VSRDDEWSALRERMLRSVELEASPRDPRVLEAFRRVPRHLFVPEPMRSSAYDDRALPIGEDQTISQPSMIAMMLDALECEPTSRVLRGRGGLRLRRRAPLVPGRTGGRHRDSTESRPARQSDAREHRDHERVIHIADGSKGLVERAPFDRILVSAAPRDVPKALLSQLAEGGRIAIPVGDTHHQVLVIGDRQADGTVSFRRDVPCVFVPLVET